ncbi:MAG: hypothetical protein I8H75_01415 [Myxococcaceae bacterium]|nr:hypothetical protein [Myxococcaceae bacterium]MBH2005999.1 hypothetical protein [Myxococcaceae bacterium]
MTVREQLLLLSDLAAKDFNIRGLIDQEKVLRAVANQAKVKIDCVNVQGKEVQDKLNVCLKQKGLHELELQTEKMNLRKWEARADKIRGEREYSTLISEIGFQKRLISESETKLLELFEVEERLKKELAGVQEELRKATLLLQEETDQVKAQLVELAERRFQEEEDRTQAFVRLPSSLGKRYEQVASKRAGVAIAILSQGVCTACKRALPPELYNRVSKGELLESCPFCQRLLIPEVLS